MTASTAGQKGGINISALDKNNTTYSLCLQHNTNWKYIDCHYHDNQVQYMVRVDKQIIGQSHMYSQSYLRHFAPMFPGFL